MENYIEGRLIKKLEITTHGASFKKMEFIINTDDKKYPQEIKLIVVQDKIEKVNELPVGTKAKWFFNLKGRTWENPEGKTIYFNSIEVWRVEITGTDLNPLPEEEEVNDVLPF